MPESDGNSPHAAEQAARTASGPSDAGAHPSGEPGVAGGSGGEVDLATTKKEFIQTFFKRAEEFTETLLRENEKLRYQILDLEGRLRRVAGTDEKVSTAGALRELAGRIEALESEREQILGRVRSVQDENSSFVQRYREIERENNNLANLYVASFQLHSTIDLREVTQIIVEILLNFIGAKTFAVLLLDEKRGVLRPLASEGIAREQVPVMRPGEGAVGGVVVTGQPIVGNIRLLPPLPPVNAAPPVTYDLDHPITVSPLRIRDKVVGAIVVWEFLQQKTELQDVDHELFNLLSAHAATAIYTARLAQDHQVRGDGVSALAGVVDLV